MRAWGALALVLASTLSSPASGAPPLSIPEEAPSAPFAEAAEAIERTARWSVAGLGTVLGHEVEGSVVVACTHRLDGPRPLLPQDAAAASEAADGSRVVLERGGVRGWHNDRGVTSVCDTLPASELPLAVWLLSKQRRLVERLCVPPCAPDPAQRPLVESLRAGTDRIQRLVFQHAPAARARAATVRAEQPPATLGSLVFPSSLAGAVAQLLRSRGSPPPPVRSAAWTQATRQSSERLGVLESDAVAAPLVHYAWGIAGAPLSRKVALEVAGAILARGWGSRLRRDLVVRRKRAVAVSAWTARAAGGELVGLTVAVSPRSTVDETQRFIDGALLQLRIIGPTVAEVARSKALLLTSRGSQIASPASLARLMAHAELAWGDYHALSEYLAALRAVDHVAVRKAASLTLLPTLRAVVEVYPRGWPQDDPALAAYELHTVQIGDTLAALASRYGVSASDIVGDNDLDPHFRLPVGQALWIRPAPGRVPQEAVPGGW